MGGHLPDTDGRYFWLDPKVTKKSRLNRPVYSGQRLRCRLRNSLRSNSAGSCRFVFTLRFTPVRLGLSKKAPLSLRMADTACYISISNPQTPSASLFGAASLRIKRNKPCAASFFCRLLLVPQAFFCRLLQQTDR